MTAFSNITPRSLVHRSDDESACTSETLVYHDTTRHYILHYSSQHAYSILAHMVQHRVRNQ